jgi:hypothetical protein
MNCSPGSSVPVLIFGNKADVLQTGHELGQNPLIFTYNTVKIL